MRCQLGYGFIQCSTQITTTVSRSLSPLWFYTSPKPSPKTEILVWKVTRCYSTVGCSNWRRPISQMGECTSWVLTTGEWSAHPCSQSSTEKERKWDKEKKPSLLWILDSPACCNDRASFVQGNAQLRQIFASGLDWQSLHTTSWSYPAGLTAFFLDPWTARNSRRVILVTAPCIASLRAIWWAVYWALTACSPLFCSTSILLT